MGGGGEVGEHVNVHPSPYTKNFDWSDERDN